MATKRPTKTKAPKTTKTAPKSKGTPSGAKTAGSKAPAVPLQAELLALWERTRKTILYVTHNIQEAVFMADRVVVLSRRPGRVLDTVVIDLPRPRSLDSRETPEFGKYAKHIRRRFEELGVLKGKV